MIRKFNLSKIIDLYNKSLSYIARQCNIRRNIKYLKCNIKMKYQ